MENRYLSRYLRLKEMAKDEQQPIDRREIFEMTTLCMVFNTTFTEGIPFMPAQEHTVFLAALKEHETNTQE